MPYSKCLSFPLTVTENPLYEGYKKFKKICHNHDKSNMKIEHKMLKVCIKLAALLAEWPGRRKTYGPGETRTHDHAFRGHLLYH